jgi:hypothetical protein
MGLVRNAPRQTAAVAVAVGSKQALMRARIPARKLTLQRVKGWARLQALQQLLAPVWSVRQPPMPALAA